MTDILIQAKQGQVKTWMEMAKMCQEVGDSVTATSAMSSAKALLAEISELVEELRKLKNVCAPVSAEVEAYLEKGRVTMGITGPAAKKHKADGTVVQKKGPAVVVQKKGPAEITDSSGKGGDGP